MDDRMPRRVTTQKTPFANAGKGWGRKNWGRSRIGTSWKYEGETTMLTLDRREGIVEMEGPPFLEMNTPISDAARTREDLKRPGLLGGQYKRKEPAKKRKKGYGTVPWSYKT